MRDKLDGHRAVYRNAEIWRYRVIRELVLATICLREFMIAILLLGAAMIACLSAPSFANDWGSILAIAAVGGAVGTLTSYVQEKRWLSKFEESFMSDPAPDEIEGSLSI